MRRKINLFEILCERGDLGLVQYLKEVGDDDLQYLKREYVTNKKMTDRKQITIEILRKMEKTLNTGYVFNDDLPMHYLVDLYE